MNPLSAYIIASIFALFATFSLKKNRVITVTLIFMSFLSLLLPLALRAKTVGIDTPAYYSFFYKVLYSSTPYSSFRIEPAYTLLNQTISVLGFDAPALIFTAAILSLAPVFIFIHKYSPNPILSISILCGTSIYGFMYNGVRQAIAMAISLLALQLLLDKKYYKYFLTLFIASQFHYTAIVFATTIIIIRFKYNYITAILLWLVSLAFLIPSVANIFFSQVAGLFPEAYSGYANTVIEASSIRLRFLTNQIFCIFFLIMLWSNHKQKVLDERSLSLLYLSLFSFIAGNLIFHFGYITRLILYFQIISVITIPILISKLFTRTSYYLLCIVMYTIFTLIYLRSLDLKSNGMVPYFSIWH